MITHRFDVKRLLGVIVLLSVGLFSGLLLVTESLSGALLNESFISLGVLLAWIYFERTGWRQRYLRVGGWFCDLPDLNGRWEGTLFRIGESSPESFVIEICQTMSTIQCNTFSLNGHSESICADIVTDQSKQNFRLVYTWLASAGLLKGAETGMFFGTTILRFAEGSERLLEGEYFTGRRPTQTRGKINVKWKGRQLYSRFTASAEERVQCQS